MAVWLAGGIGGGDAKLAGAVGALAGWRFALSTLLFGLLAAMVMAVIVMLRRRILRRTLARVGRFVYLAFTPGKPADPTSADSPKIPFGLALCLGACVALVEVFWRGGGAPKWFLGI
ncbi:MAG TPA: hypothetical protein DCX07_01400 [Phycisphaerales bacterium]|nr:hypothetical protein [Phycisphaerales bacterium]